MNHKQLAQQFALGATSGKSSNMFIEGDTIYSYGYHFKIAKRLGDYAYLVNAKNYSNSTGKQKGHVLSALDSNAIIETPDCKIDYAYGYLTTEINNAKAKLERARTESSKASWQYQIDTHTKQLKLLATLGITE